MQRSAQKGKFLQQRDERSVRACNLEGLHHRFFSGLTSVAHKVWLMGGCVVCHKTQQNTIQHDAVTLQNGTRS